MRIATLGSCLSRRTVDSFVETFGGELLSCF